MEESRETFRLRCGDAAAEIAAVGAEPLSWTVAGRRELLWHGDPEHWSFRAPILFPVVGASRGGVVRVDGVGHPMAQHGFARHARFRLVERTEGSARLCLTENDATLAAYPFPFRLDVIATLRTASLDLAFEVLNTGPGPMPFGLGFHPAFSWPFAGGGREDHAVVFEAAEDASVPEVAAGGLLARRRRAVPLAGDRLPLAPELFTEALVFLRARSRTMRFVAPSGHEIAMAMRGFPHLAVWSRPTAPFLSLEAWTAHADWEDAEGELADRDSMILLGPGETSRHAATLSWCGAPAA